MNRLCAILLVFLFGCAPTSVKRVASIVNGEPVWSASRGWHLENPVPIAEDGTHCLSFKVPAEYNSQEFLPTPVSDISWLVGKQLRCNWE